MKLEMTARDRKLLKWTFCVLILFLALRFVIMPGIAEYQETGLLLEERQAEAESMRHAIDSIPVLEEETEQEELHLEEVSAPYYGALENREVDALMTGLVLSHDLFPVSLSIEETKPELPPAYVYGAEAEEGTVNPPVEYVRTARATAVLRGSGVQVRALLDDVKENYPAMQVYRMSTQESTYVNGDLREIQETECTLELKLFLCEEPEVLEPAGGEDKTGEGQEDGAQQTAGEDKT